MIGELVQKAQTWVDQHTAATLSNLRMQQLQKVKKLCFLLLFDSSVNNEASRWNSFRAVHPTSAICKPSYVFSAEAKLTFSK
jgi:hypothetical protein